MNSTLAGRAAAHAAAAASRTVTLERHARGDQAGAHDPAEQHGPRRREATRADFGDEGVGNKHALAIPDRLVAVSAPDARERDNNTSCGGADNASSYRLDGRADLRREHHRTRITEPELG